ncbi:MAG: preprotein translocase subunit SecG [Pseudomonadota bacterium]
MSTTFIVLSVAHLFVSIGIIALVLMQRGKGADAGAAFGSGASGTVFGARGSANFLSRATAVLATVFFVNSLALAYLTTQRTPDESVVDSIVLPVEEVPADAAVDSLSDIPSIDEAGQEAAETLDDVPAFEDDTTDEAVGEDPDPGQ